MQPVTSKFKFSERTNFIPKSFIREILKSSTQPNVISFAGGLPNPSLFPLEAIKKAAIKVFEEDGRSALQYSISQGYLPLREYLSEWYEKKGLLVSPEEIVITNGSQQALDLIGKVFIDKNDTILLERPSYLGAIQAFSAYQPRFSSIHLEADGIDVNALREKLIHSSAKMFYSIPNFQNPTGIRYSEVKRKVVGELINNSNTIIVEDNPYGEINFTTNEFSTIKKYAGSKGILLGSFSKIISPGMRTGWLVADKEIIQKILVAKEACDLHSNQLSQKIITRYLLDNDIEQHLNVLKTEYKKQRDCMVKCIRTFLGDQIIMNEPQGGMFCWLQFINKINTTELIQMAAQKGVLFVPGSVFYTDQSKENTLRLNFTNSSLLQIEKGVEILGNCVNDYLNKSA